MYGCNGDLRNRFKIRKNGLKFKFEFLCYFIGICCFEDDFFRVGWDLKLELSLV